MPINPFSITCKTDVHFGAGTHRKLIDLLPQGVQSILLVKGVSNGPSAPVRLLLSGAGFHCATVVCASEPSVRSVNEAWRAIGKIPVDCIVVCGGGSAIDTGKALRIAVQKGAPLTDDDFAVNHVACVDIPLIVLPTTAGTGSEVTPNAVLGAATRDAKISLRGQGLQPSIAIVDPDLMRAAPKAVALYAGLDAVVQNIEAHISAFANPFTRALSGPAVSSTLGALRDVIERDDPDAWTQLAWGSLSSGIALANGGLGAVHGLASILGAAYPAPHGALCGRLLTPVLKANLASELCTEDIRCDIMMCQQAILDVFAPTDPLDPLSGFESWLTTQNLPRLAHWGIQSDQIDALAEAALSASSSLKNPVKLETIELAQVLRDAL
ncbi:iron-containing alcohol dehydrogenase [Aliiroseovarius sp. PrR006]|uniref:iron-containing alcohol dehydrogenase n=1 Tax=Aliiroseovarius sp. PrR006 TaxID=2706883 RepID=UPI0013D7040E|nr:iron-containing alcohol dehydrogenase [Aliiroseovarius sp. PrR006]NDW52784.1 iron-containing alcohol dehydrogenase [Aliiroseovarius sp. PrR006]